MPENPTRIWVFLAAHLEIQEITLEEYWSCGLPETNDRYNPGNPKGTIFPGNRSFYCDGEWFWTKEAAMNAWAKIRIPWLQKQTKHLQNEINEIQEEIGKEQNT